MSECNNSGAKSKDDDLSLESQEEESKGELENNDKNEGSGQISDNRYISPLTMSPSSLQL